MFKRTYFINFKDKDGGLHWRLKNFKGWTFDNVEICKDMIADKDYGNGYLPSDVNVAAFYRVK